MPPPLPLSMDVYIKSMLLLLPPSFVSDSALALMQTLLWIQRMFGGMMHWLCECACWLHAYGHTYTPVAQRHQMVRGSLTLLNSYCQIAACTLPLLIPPNYGPDVTCTVKLIFSLFLRVKQGGSPNEGTKSCRMGYFLSIHKSICSQAYTFFS